MNKKKVAVSWSSGKDSAYTYAKLSRDTEIVSLFTTYNPATGRLPIQGTPIEAVRAQARCLAVPLLEIELPENCPNSEYERRVATALAGHLSRFQCLAFGDLFLDGIREYRESFLKPAGFECLFPLMGVETASLSGEILAAGLKARICSVDSTLLDPKYIGREYDHRLLADLPPGIDPCGERGEFHTYVYDGPIFRVPPAIQFEKARSFGRFTHLEMSVGS